MGVHRASAARRSIREVPAVAGPVAGSGGLAYSLLALGRAGTYSGVGAGVDADGGG